MKKIDISGTLAIGNGENCPFCKGDTVFVASEDNDIVEHMMEEHPSELNRALFSDPPPKQWLEQPFQLAIAKIAVQLKFLNEDREKLVPHEEFEERMHNIYSVLKDYFKNESN